MRSNQHLDALVMHKRKQAGELSLVGGVQVQLRLIDDEEVSGLRPVQNVEVKVHQ